MQTRSNLWQNKSSPKFEVVILLAVVVLAAGLRIAYLSVAGLWHKPPSYDGFEYDLLAAHLLGGQGFVTTVGGPPYGFRTPGFPFFLASLYMLFGHSYFVVRLANVCLGALTCLPVYFFAKQVWRWQTGAIASVGMATHPLLIYLTRMIYPECLILFLTAVVFLIVARIARSRRMKDAVPLGVALGFLVHLRPSFLLFGLAQTICMWLSFRTVSKRLFASATLVIVIFLIIIPWSIRNYLAFDEFIWISTHGGVTFWAGNNPLADGGWVEPSPATWPGDDPPTDLRGWPGLSEKESEARFRAEAIRWIRQHPAQFLSLLPKKLVRAWSLSMGNETRQIELPPLVPIAYSVFLVVSLLGFLLSLSRWRELMSLYLLVGVLTLTTLIFYGSTRQSSALALPLVVFASSAVDRVISFALSNSARKTT